LCKCTYRFAPGLQDCQTATGKNGREALEIIKIDTTKI